MKQTEQTQTHSQNKETVHPKERIQIVEERIEVQKAEEQPKPHVEQLQFRDEKGQKQKKENERKQLLLEQANIITQQLQQLKKVAYLHYIN